ncbi:conserved hypothetical protein [Talaromyces stipitatus ATCC 10500]|uniref:Uncharacterized protein n=1 Tax=Talaromyces stipitatus (strain ATCC 10500 / CBS 375.48 / QM 6759 / NRRL 1006) TaxID=441959 RepID=B8MBD0_TALSN|nr:uncharacterized protein TSTA_126270 [Talaromyces stipitatus ATCC 10500]EED18919.1 conserved hypothetical protein [Talaromyces stipitatus ATCC 10500]
MSSLRIPGIPYMRGPRGLGRLTAASAFLQLPRSPVKFRRNVRTCDIPSTPVCKLPRRITPDAPRRRGFQATPATSAIPFPSHAPSKPPSPTRYCVWPTPSMSKNGVSRALQNRSYNPSSPLPSRIPVAVDIRSALPVIPCPSALRKRVNFVNPMTAIHANDGSPVKAKSSRRTYHPKPELVARTRLYLKLAQIRKSMVSRSANPLRSILVRPGSEKVAKKKGVRFGPTLIREVNYWIDRKRNVFQDGGLWQMGRLQGWRITPLSTPNEDGETEKYMTMWGHDHNVIECPHEGCVWGSIALFVKYCRLKRMDLGCEGENLMPLWSAYRQKARDAGYDYL